MWGLKSDTFSHPGHSITHLRSLRKSNSKFKRRQVQFCSKVQVKLLFSLLMSKLGYSRETLALALYFFEHIMGEQDFDKGLHNQQKNEIIYAATCMSLAAKKVELEKRHVNMSAVKGILQSDLRKKDFANAELAIFRHFAYELPAVTFLDFLNYYLMKGGVLSNEPFKDAARFEARIGEVAWEYLKSGEFIERDQESLAAHILFQCRKEFKPSEIWNWHIEHYTKIDLHGIRSILAQMEVVSPQPYSNILSVSRSPNLINKLCFMSPSPKKRKVSIQNIEESIECVRKKFSELRTSRSGSECKMQSVRSSSSLNKFTLRIE